ncbi:LuxR family transcriptional regulator [Nocardioides sp. B-3]|uniref:LuxR family transcriptional regulator n=1 Tax=Nocardioides sp. B-3 TaxID=2895565 RepID=UPI002152A302|nr:LuxR family transcriptional regulator [Nocardioides sp. B-3]UUZ60926.1 LuxR family transcriptional regulator [Nocardioides sp. B-3]
MSYGPEERSVFETAASELYEDLVGSAGIASDDPRIDESGAAAQPFALLKEIGPVTFDKGERRWIPVDPAIVQSHVVSPLGQQGAELLAESAQWAKAFRGLSHAWRRSPEALRGPFAELRGDAITPYITSLVADASEELLTAQPQTGRAIDQLPVVVERDVGALRRGVMMRTLYQHSARRQVATNKYVAAVTVEGAQVRTLDEFFDRLIVIDRRIAIVPGRNNAGESVALAVREPSLVAYLVDIFERSRERGRPFTSRDATLVRAIEAEQRAMTIRMLIGGHSDPVAAKRLGVSPRTYAGYVSELKKEFEVDSRFQLGYEMGRRGVTGRDSPPGTHQDAPEQSGESV